MTKPLQSGLALAIVAAVAPELALAAETPAPVTDLLYARPFVVQAGYRTHWHQDLALVEHGFIVVLGVDPRFMMPHGSEMPVLLAGEHTVELLNSGYPSGIVVGIVPQVSNLLETTFWFGAPAFPDALGAEVILASREEAVAAEIGPFPATRIAEALTLGGSLLVAVNRDELIQRATPLISQFNAGR